MEKRICSIEKSVKKILITGPECSGKSTLATHLSRKLDAVVVKEVARSYLEKNGLNYQYTDLEKIARLQLQEEKLQKQKTNAEYLIADTGILVIKIWSLDKFGKVDPWISEATSKMKYDFIFLCKPDFPWAYDSQREDKYRRMELFEIYKSELLKNNRQAVVLENDVDRRVEMVLKELSKQDRRFV